MDRKGPRSGGHRTTRSHSGAEKSDGWLSILLGFSFPLASVKPLKGEAAELHSTRLSASASASASGFQFWVLALPIRPGARAHAVWTV
ncbi:hypothetical protein MferCBS31731_004949 [Microsporum ferrugineum]